MAGTLLATSLAAKMHTEETRGMHVLLRRLTCHMGAWGAFLWILETLAHLSDYCAWHNQHIHTHTLA